jgi:RimJ/RimL family protein N-acetyltransferase
MKIIEITANDSHGYKQFVSGGFIKHEECFRITAKDESGDPFPTKGNPHSFTLAAVDDAGKLMGVASFKRETDNREKLSHKGLLFRMYVAEENVGKGIGGALIRNLVDRVKILGDIEQINLTVVSTNVKAKNLYERVGFKVFGTEKNSIKRGGKYYDEDLMALQIKLI